jgi:hypothetical protein
LLKLSVSLPDTCKDTPIAVDVCAEIADRCLLVTVGVCELPGCDEPFVRVHPMQRYHSRECKRIANNKYQRN